VKKDKRFWQKHFASFNFFVIVPFVVLNRVGLAYQVGPL
jgi:aromatic ring-cleaving dioxygenase